MKGFSGDDIMVGGGSFTKFIGGLGFDWGSYELATQGVDEDMNRKEFIAPNGLAADSIRDIWQHTEGASGSAFDDIIIGDNDTRLLATKDELDNVNLITGLTASSIRVSCRLTAATSFWAAAATTRSRAAAATTSSTATPGCMSALTKQSAGAQIIRQILYDPNGNTWDPDPTADGGIWASAIMPAMSIRPSISDVFSNYDIALFGKDAEGFLTIQQIGASAIVGGNPQGLLGGSDGTDRIRNIERLQFTDMTVSIDANGRILTSSDGRFVDNDPISRAHYDAVAG